jgi:hypothetical protein
VTPDGVAETRQHNTRFQLARITVTAPANNGQVGVMKNWVSGEEVNYSYDAQGRLSEASTTGPGWGLSFSYDGFGNKTARGTRRRYRGCRA